MLALLLPAALAAPWLLADAGRPGLRGEPVALVIATPGLGAACYGELAGALEVERMDAWLLRFPLAAQDPAEIPARWIPEAIASFSGTDVLLVGHGIGGTFAAISVAEGRSRPAGLALLGAPLRFLPLALTEWLAGRPLPSRPLDLDDYAAAAWNGRPILPLLLGEPLPAFEPVSPALLGWLQQAIREEREISLRETEIPVWAGAAALDNLAPPEAIRAMLPAGSFSRFGYLHLQAGDPDHLDLLTSPAATRALARWGRSVLR